MYYKHKNDYLKNDIVVVNAQDYLTGQTDPIIKRVIATAGDTLTFDFYNIESTLLILQDLHIYKCYYNIYLNDELLTEDYLAEDKCYLEIKTNTRGEYIDSEDYAFLKQAHSVLRTENPAKYINEGKVTLNIQQHEVFICGDNRNYSTDSRYFGSIKNTDILGVMAIHVPYGTNLFVGIWRTIFS